MTLFIMLAGFYDSGINGYIDTVEADITPDDFKFYWDAYLRAWSNSEALHTDIHDMSLLVNQSYKNGDVATFIAWMDRIYYIKITPIEAYPVEVYN